MNLAYWVLGYDALQELDKLNSSLSIKDEVHEAPSRRPLRWIRSSCGPCRALEPATACRAASID